MTEQTVTVLTLMPLTVILVIVGFVLCPWMFRSGVGSQQHDV